MEEEKMQLIYGTTNPAKLAAMRKRLEMLPVEIVGLSEVRHLVSDEVWRELQSIPEDGDTPLENARKKVRRFYEAFRRPVFSCDTGLYFDHVPEEIQPGVHVRTVGGRRLSDEEMTAYYASLAEKYGDLRARYRSAICLKITSELEYGSMDETLAGGYFILTSRPHERACKPGFPLDRISVDCSTGKYFYDLPDSVPNKIAVEDGMVEFFRKVLNL